MTESDTYGGRLRAIPRLRFRAPGYEELVYALVLSWGFCDGLSTLFAARYAGPEFEANPWIRTLLIQEPLSVLVLKMAVVLYVGVVLLRCRSVVVRVPWWRGWLVAVVAGGALVALLNVVVGLVAAVA